MAWRSALLWLLLPSSVVGQLLLGLSLTKSGPSHEVQKAQLIEQSLELVVSRANDNAFTPNGFQDHRGNPIQFGLRVFDDEGNATKVKELYRAMIQDRLVDLLLGPQTQALSEAARSVTTALQRTLMLWSLHTMSVDNFPLQAGQPGTFSVAVPVENMMDQGLRMLKSLGSTEVRAIVGTDRISEFMCSKAIERAEALGYAPGSIVVRPLNNYELLTQMQLRFTRPLDVLLTCTSEAEMLNVVMVASRLNVSAQAMLSYNADSLATYNTVGPAVTALLAPSDWHHELSYPCRAFIDTQTYVQIFQFRYNQLPSAGAAVATAAAVTLMATLQQTTFEGPDLDKNIRLAAQLQSTVVNTMVGPVRFKADGSSDRMAVTVQVAEVEGVGFQGQLLNETNLSNLEWPMPSWDSKFQRELECPKGTIYNAFVAGNGTESCLLCPAGFSNAPKGEWCQACSVGSFARSEGSECLPCAPGANCIASGTTTPGSLPEYYRFDASPDGVLYFLKCLDGLCLGDNQCLGSNTGALCLSCLPGTTNMGVMRRKFQCSNCLPTAVLVIFLILYFLIIYFFVVITAEASVHGMIWKRVISYWQICSAATHVGRLYRTDGFLQLISDLILYPFHTLLGPECLFFGAARNSQTFVFVTGALLMPAIFAASTVFFIVKTGIQVSINSQNARSKRGRKDKLPIKELFIKTIMGATRWNVASLYVLYCPTLIIFVSCCSFVQFDVLRMRYWLDVPLSEVTFFAVFSGTVMVLQGLAIPTCLLLILRRLKNRNSLKDANSQYVLGMLYNDMKPEYWFYEITFFFKRFLFMAATAIPDEVLRILVFAWVAFLHLQSLVLMKPFSTLEGNILLKLETCFILSVYVILSSQIALIWFDNAASEVVALTLVYLTHTVFSLMVIRSLMTSLIYQPLTLKALAMPQAMNPLERLICHADSITRVSWDSSRQRLHFYNLTRRSRLKLLNTLNEVLHVYIARGDEFHASYLSVAIEQAVSHCVKQRREALVAHHPRMLAQERRRGISGCLAYWFPSLLLGSRSAEGIALAKQQRIDRRSLNSALPLVSTHEATMNEFHSAFFDYAFHQILRADLEFFQVKETPVELRHWAPKGTKDKKRTIRSNLLMRKAPTGDSETWREEKTAEVTVEVKPKLSEEQLTAELPQLLAEAEQLQAERDDLLNRLEEKEADIEWLSEMLDEEEEIPCDDPRAASDPATMPGELGARC